MTHNLNSFFIDILDMQECDGIAMYIPVATGFGQNFEEGIDWIFYVIRTLQITKTNLYFILSISEDSIYIYIYIRLVVLRRVFYS